MADLKKYTVQEALNRVMDDADASLNVKLTSSDQITIANASLDVNLSSATDTVTNVPTTASATVKTADAQVKGSAGTLWSVQVDFVGTTIGDKVEIKNSTDNSGAALMTFTSTAANQSFTFTPPVGIAYSAGIYSDETKSGGNITVTVVYS